MVEIVAVLRPYEAVVACLATRVPQGILAMHGLLESQFFIHFEIVRSACLVDSIVEH